MSTLAEQWIEEGFEKGVKIGMAEGKAEGMAEGMLSLLLVTLDARYGSASTILKERVNHVTDLEKLTAIHRQAIVSSSPEEFEAYLNQVIGEVH